MTITIKQNDTVPALEAQLVNADGTAIDLTLCSVWLHMGNKINAVSEITDAIKGWVKYAWQTGDTDTVGLYKAEFEIKYPDGAIQTVPNDGYFLIQIVNELA